MAKMLPWFLALVLTLQSSAQQTARLEWVRTYNGPANGIDMPTAMALDAEGSVYVCGRSQAAGSGFDYTILKYRADGLRLLELRWAGVGSSWDEPADLAVDRVGNMYVTGSSDNHSIVTLKYRGTGALLWVARYDHPSGIKGQRIALDSEANVYVGGTAETAAGAQEMVVLKYSSRGHLIWQKRLSDPAGVGVELADLKLDEAGNIYLAGSVCTASSNVGCLYDAYMTKLSSNGALQWQNLFWLGDSTREVAKEILLGAAYRVVLGGTVDDQAFFLVSYSPLGLTQWVQSGGAGQPSPAVVISDFATACRGHVLVSGYAFRPGENFNVFALKLDSLGHRVWEVEHNSAAQNRDFALAMAVDSRDNVYITGNTEGSQPLSDSTALFVVKFDSSGRYQWSAAYTDTLWQWAYGQFVSIDSSGNVYVVGQGASHTHLADFLILKFTQGLVGFQSRPTPKAAQQLLQNSPNPFNGNTRIQYALSKPSVVEVVIFNPLGQPVFTFNPGRQPAGEHSLIWDGRDADGRVLPTGLYVYVLKIDNRLQAAGKMLMLK